MADVVGRSLLVDKARRGRIDEIVAACVIWTSALLVVAFLAGLIGTVAWRGVSKLSLDFIVQPPRDAGLAGGIGPILVSTLVLLVIALVAAVPIGLATAMLLSEFTRQGGRFGRAVRLSLDILAGVPSIVFGLFGNAFFSIYLGLGFSLLSGGLTLACMVLPLFIRASEEGFRAVPDDYRQAAAALGISRASVIRHILLPAATPGIIVGLVLGIGRAAAETAALIFTSGYVDRMPDSLLDSGRALALHIFDLAMNVPGGDGNAYASTLVLIVLVLVINALTTWIGSRWLQRRISVV
jgi:phosphate transport system permease protein